ncbi:AcrR family transcriptional regulator [Bacillus thermophilus]|uniref:AcrR family transcriptional regulator n=2 Tax=Bacillaceae TaxID=186817 RepID=A0ABS2R1P4_9BACI|nr:AcrR family transcriptional regulator [Siminovitchia thermophila]
MWKVILKKGMEGATVRNIAQEAGLSLGALRHYFPNQDELIVYAMDLVQEKVTKRIRTKSEGDFSPKEMVMNVLLDIVPINEEQLIETEVWFAFMAHVKHRKDELPIPEDGVFTVVQQTIHFLDTHGLLKPGLDIDMEIERLYALVDGIAIHALLDPNRLSKKRVIKTIEYHLDSICVDPL